MITCNDVGQKVNLLLDNELSEEDRREVMNHLVTCKSCNEIYQAGTLLKDLIKSGHRTVPKKVIDEVTALLNAH